MQLFRELSTFRESNLMLSFDFGVKFRSRVKAKMRRLTSWALTALLPASMAEEIARMEPRSRGSADS
jgi:hypothetical protein